MTITLDIDPGQLRINSRYQIAGGRLVLATRYRQGVELARLQVRQACIKSGWRTSSKPVRVSMTTFWRTAHGDVDSVSKAVLDSLTRGLAIDDDGQVVELVARKAVDSTSPRIELEIEELSDA